MVVCWLCFHSWYSGVVFFQVWGREGKVWLISATCFTKLLRVCGNRKNSTLNSGPSRDFTEDFCALFCYKLSALLLCSCLVGHALRCTHKPVKLLLKEIWKKRVARAVLCLCEEAAHQPEASHSRLEKACQFCVIFILTQIAHWIPFSGHSLSGPLLLKVCASEDTVACHFLLCPSNATGNRREQQMYNRFGIF